MNNYWTRIGQGITHFFSWAYNNHPGKLTGISLGFLVGLFFVTLGFWRTLILFIFIAVCYILEKVRMIIKFIIMAGTIIKVTCLSLRLNYVYCSLSKSDLRAWQTKDLIILYLRQGCIE